MLCYVMLCYVMLCYVIEKYSSRYCYLPWWLIAPFSRLHHLIKSDALSVRMNYTKSGKEILMSTVNEFFYCILSTQQFAPRLLHHAFLTFNLCKRMFDNLFEIYSRGMLTFVWKSTCRSESMKCTKWRMKWVCNHALGVEHC